MYLIISQLIFINVVLIPIYHCTRFLVPEITVSNRPSMTMKFTKLYPRINTISVEIGSKDFSISGISAGRWKLPNGTYISSSTVLFPILLYDHFGLYKFYVDNWDGDELCIIQIAIILGG